MKILVVGSAGLVGSRFVELTKFKDFLFLPNSTELDITNFENVKDYFSKASPDVVINFAAFTNVSEGENQRGDTNGPCWKINVEGVKNLLENLDTKITHFVHISTDMVFPGSKEIPGPYDEDHALDLDPSKLTWYGYTKACAEKLIADKISKNGVILRLNYPVRSKYPQKLDYLRKPLKLFDDGKLYPMFCDQQVSFTFIDEVAEILDKLIDLKIGGTYHASSSDLTTPYDAISYLLEVARFKTGVVQKSSLVDFLKTVNNPVRYPQFGGLGVKLTEKKLGFKFSSWKKIIDQLVKQGIEV